MDAPGIPGLRSDASTERAKSRLKSATRAVRLFPGPVRPTIQTIAAPIVCIGTLYASKSEPLPLSIELEIPGNRYRLSIRREEDLDSCQETGSSERNAATLLSRGNAQISLVIREFDFGGRAREKF